ncbi:MAG: GIY-YIG nuclease family protein [Planctomycetota bacterium]|nr:GIY-YIG nuclease family protein [Planctomycetota bacterium]
MAANEIPLAGGGGLLVRGAPPRQDGRAKGPKAYFIENVDTGRIKIGSTVRDPQSRLSGLQVGSDCQLALIGWLWATDVSEVELHARFRAHHVRGEWFSPAIKPHVLALLGTDVPPHPQAEAIRAAIAERRRRARLAGAPSRLGTIAEVDAEIERTHAAMRSGDPRLARALGKSLASLQWLRAAMERRA